MKLVWRKIGKEKFKKYEKQQAYKPDSVYRQYLSAFLSFIYAIYPSGPINPLLDLSAKRAVLLGKTNGLTNTRIYMILQLVRRTARMSPLRLVGSYPTFSPLSRQVGKVFLFSAPIPSRISLISRVLCPVLSGLSFLKYQSVSERQDSLLFFRFKFTFKIVEFEF